MDAGSILIAAQLIPAVSAAFTISGEVKIITYGLAAGEYVVLLEEEPGGTYVPAVNANGVGVQLTTKQSSQIIVGYGSYKLQKTATVNAVAVAVLS